LEELTSGEQLQGGTPWPPVLAHKQLTPSLNRSVSYS
jgi:hypothetical protein